MVEVHVRFEVVLAFGLVGTIRAGELRSIEDHGTLVLFVPVECFLVFVRLETELAMKPRHPQLHRDVVLLQIKLVQDGCNKLNHL